ncbi:MAG: diguanylate cyclase [Thermoanaerobaculales bacterium]|jgi:diguanylate cyclase (GGDEF)-like protein|nr:diguanylate cyclase [Thermoanaerobaculales bacterium]
MKKMSMRARMVIVAAVSTLIACIGLVGAGAYINQVEMDEALIARAEATSDRLEIFAVEGSAFQMQDGVDRMVDAGSVFATVVFSPGGDVIAAAPPLAELGALLSAVPELAYEIRTLTVGETEVMAVSVNLASGGSAWVVFEKGPYAAARSRLHLGWLIAAVGAVLVALMIALAAARSPDKGLTEIRAALDRIGEGNFDTRCDVDGPSEIAAIARDINQMAAKLEVFVSELGAERSALEQQVSGRTRELEQANRLLMDIANRDALTGLANRRRLEMELERNISFSKRTGQPLAVIMMDLDKFKICNDTAGHLVGDNILRAVASTLRSRVRVTDLVVRWGGDEFCILVPATQPQGAVAAAESLVDAVREATTAIALPAPLEPPTASAGVACFPEDGEDPHTLILNADAALYQVKATGRGRVLRYSPEFSKD